MCDTCPDNQDKDFALKNQPQFLLRKMVKCSDSLYIFSDPTRFSIMPLLKLGQTFVFNEELNVNAEISFEGTESIFGKNDSVKYISLSNGNMIKISKNFGIVQFQEYDKTYDLIGMKNGKNAYGVNPLTFRDFFEYDVDDVIQRKRFSASYGDGWYISDITSKFRIDSKYIRGDTIKYKISGWKYTRIESYIPPSPMSFKTFVGRFSNVLTYVDSANHFIHKYPNEMIDISDHTEENFYEIMLNRAEHIKENDRLVIKSGSYCEKGEECEGFYPYYAENSQNSDLLIRNISRYSGPDEIEIKYIEGCGYSFRYYFFEHGGSDVFMGKIHLGDTIGTVFPDSYFEKYINIEMNEERKIEIYTNPVNRNESLHIRTDFNIEKYQITDVAGKIILSGHFVSGEIPLNNITSGLYFLELTTDDKVFIKRILIK